MTPRALLEGFYWAAVGAVHPSNCLDPYLPPAPARGRLIMLAAGKAAGAMIEAAEARYAAEGISKGPVVGVAVTRRGYARPSRWVPVIEAGHPVPDQAGVEGTAQTLAWADQAQAEDLVLVLLSGGASANWIAPAEGVSLAAKQEITRALLNSGAAIDEINAVRKHLSRIKGGRLAKRAQPARVLTLAISDVPGDDPATIGSGPTVSDPTMLEDARQVLAKHDLQTSDAIRRALLDPRNESPKPGDPAFDHAEYRIVAGAADALRAAEAAVRAAGYECINLGERLEGEAREVAAAHAALAGRLYAEGRRAVILSGGELTVTIRGKGRGGPNQEYALGLAVALAGTPGIYALAADTDGTDGGAGSPDDPAGAFVAPETWRRAQSEGRDPAVFLTNNDSRAFFEPLGDLLNTGPTCTNVADFRAILVDRT